MSIKNLIGKIPEVKYPKEELSIEDRIKWTVGVAVLVLVMGVIPLPISLDNIPPSYQLMRMIYGSSLFTMVAVGIGPILIAILILQILLRLNVIRLDLEKIEDRKFFYGMQKMLIVVIAFFETSAIVFGFHLASSFAGTVFLLSLLIFGVIALIYMDEIVVKWGIGSGLGLFISVGAIKILLYRLFNPMSDVEGNIYGIIPNFLNRLINQSIFDISLIFPIIATAFIFTIIYIGFKKKTEFPISTKIVSGKYSMKFFYVSTLALGYSSVIMTIQMLAISSGVDMYNPPPLTDMNAWQQATYMLVSNLTPGNLYGSLSPENWYMLLDSSVLIHLMVYSIAVILVSLVLGYGFAQLVGLDLFYIKQSPRVKIMIEDNKEQELRKKIMEMIIISSLAVGILSLAGDLLGIMVGFGGALITVGYLQRCHEEVKGPKKVCPNCGCLGIEWLLPSLWSIWECRNCGYRGTIVIDIEDKKV